MKTIIKLFLLSLLLPFLLQACNKATSPEAEDESLEKSADGEAEELSLSLGQIEKVGIRWDTLQWKPLSKSINANGSLKVLNQNKALVTSLYGGLVQSIHVHLGEKVKKGQLIAKVANPEFIHMQEEYLSLTSQLILAEEEFLRQKELFENQAGAKKNMQNTQEVLRRLKVKIASVEKQLQLMGIDTQKLSSERLQSVISVLSPIQGTVTQLWVQIGSYANVNTPLAELVDHSTLLLKLDIYEKDLPLLKVGQGIQFKLSNRPENSYDAEITNISSSFTGNSKSIPVYAEIKTSKEGLIEGMSTTGFINLGAALKQLIPNEALVEEAGKSFIFILKDFEKEEKENDLVYFEKIEVLKEGSELGYTAIVPINELPRGAKIVSYGAFFIQAKLTNTGEDHH